MKIPRIVRLGFEIWGYIAFAGLALILSLIVWQWLGPAKTAEASSQRTRVLLNWSGLGEERLQSVLHTYESALSGVEGDYAQAYAFKITEIPPDFLSRDTGAFDSPWQAFPLSNPILEDAFSLATGIRQSEGQSWIPEPSTITSPRFRAMFHKLTFYSTHAEYVGLFLLDTQERILYYFENKI